MKNFFLLSEKATFVPVCKDLLLSSGNNFLKSSLNSTISQFFKTLYSAYTEF